ANKLRAELGRYIEDLRGRSQDYRDQQEKIRIANRVLKAAADALPDDPLRCKEQVQLLSGRELAPGISARKALIDRRADFHIQYRGLKRDQRTVERPELRRFLSAFGQSDPARGWAQAEMDLLDKARRRLTDLDVLIELVEKLPESREFGRVVARLRELNESGP